MISRRRFLTSCGQCAMGLMVGGALSRALSAARSGSKAAALGDVTGGDPLGLGVERWTRTVCDLCPLGEPVFIGGKGGRPVAVKGIPQSTIGFGRLCPRARALVAAAVTEDRAVRPMLRRDPSTKGTLDGLVPVSWDEALAAAAGGIRSVRDRLGPPGIALLASDGETCETYGLLGRLARAGLGTDQLDTPARLDALHAYEACRQAFGVPANPGSVEDVDAAGLILLIGGDVAESHPALFYRVLDARRKGRARVVLVDWRKTEAAAVADLHLRPRPGHELAVVNALAARLLAKRAPADGAAAWLSWLRGSGSAIAPACRAPLGRGPGAARRTFAAGAALRDAGLAPEVIDSLRQLWPEEQGVVTLVGPTALGSAGGAMLARAVAQLHRATGQWGRQGRGVLFLPRGANATGILALGIAPGLLPAGGRLTNPADRARTAGAYGVPADRLPGTPGLGALEWPAAVKGGRIGAIVVHRANAAVEMPDAMQWREALTKAFVVASTTHVPTETTVFADVVLPLALVSGESAGTMMTVDRRCQLLERACDPPGEARAGDRIAMDLGRALVEPGVFAVLSGGKDWTPYAEWDRWRAMAAGTAFEAKGITSRRLGQELDVPWPSAAEDKPGAARLGAADAAPASYAPTPPPACGPGPNTARPFLLVTGPLREHFGSRMRTGRTPELHYEAPAAQLEMHPDDGRRLTLADGDWVTIESEQGAATARLWLTDRVMPGVVFLPEHFGFLSDLQGGSATQKEPEGLAHRLTSCELVAGTDSPAGLEVAVSIRRALRRDMRQRGV
jgi:anaerobic selenocysteine-containing dehydrogenase